MSERMDITQRLENAAINSVPHAEHLAGTTLYAQARTEILRLRAELAACTVPDEEVVQVMASAWTEPPETPGDGDIETARLGLSTIRAAGFTVIRTEARDGTD